jgi:hypothetical protein
MHGRPLVYRDDAFGFWGTVAQVAVRPDRIVIAAPPLDQNLRLVQCGKDLAVEQLKSAFAAGICELRSTLPFYRSNVNDVITNTDHHIAVLNVDLEFHRAACQFCKFACVVLGKIYHLKIIKTGDAVFDLFPPYLGRPAAVRVDNYLVGFATGLTHQLLAWKPQGHPHIKLAAQAFLPNVWFVIR